MILLALLLTALAIVLCVAGVIRAFMVLGLNPRDVALWLGLAEVEMPPKEPRLRLVV